jgi:hypothetical protein
MLEGTWTKLKDGSWGGRIVGEPEPGETVVVLKKDGTAQQKVVARVVWSDGQISLVAFGNAPAAGESRPAPRPVEPPPSRRRDDDDAPGYQPLPDDVLMALYAASWEGE